MRVNHDRQDVSFLHAWMADDVLAALEPSVSEHPDFHDGWGPIRARVGAFAREQHVGGLSILVTDVDAGRLDRVIGQHRGTSCVRGLRRALERAAIIDSRAIPKDVVTMNSRVLCEDERTGAQREVRLVYPRDAGSEQSAVSILTLLGSRLLGLSPGASTSEELAPLRWRVRAVTYQPEREGHFHL